MIEYWLGLTPWRKIKLTFMLILGIIVCVFAVINWAEIEVNFIFFRIKISITLLIVSCLAIGYGLSTVFEFRKYKQKDAEIAQLKKQLEQNQAISKESTTQL